MKKFFFFVLVSISLVGFTSCENSLGSDLFYYDETGCADLWWVDLNDTVVAPGVYESVVRTYLFNEGIEMYSFHTSFDSTVAELCYACHCRTGTVLQVEVASGNRRKMRRLGFYE
jgi:hypothetical protein